LSAHCHNDLGLAVANTLAAVEAGARQVECTINGIGERAGNAALEEIVMAMQVRNDRLPYATGIQAAQLWSTSQMLTEITGTSVSAKQGHRRTQCLRPRSRNASARRYEQSAVATRS